MAIHATLCYIRDGSRTLMLYRDRKPNDIHRGKYNGLGGKFEPGECPEECAQREIHEECGLTATELTLKGVITFPLFDGTSDWIVFVYLVTGFTGTLRDSPEGRLEWVPTADLANLPLWDGDRIFLPWLDAPGIFSGKFTYENGSLVHHSVVFYS